MRNFEDGEYVFRQGDEGDGLYVISEGTAVVTRLGSNLEEHELMRLGESTYFGERALLQNETRAANVLASGYLRTLYMSRATFERILGPLQSILDDDRRKREHAAQQRQAQVKALSIANCTVNSFGIESLVCDLPCGGFFIGTLLSTGERYTLRQENKEMLLQRKNQDRVEREREVLRAASEIEILPASLPVPIHFFQSPTSLFTVYHCHACCDLATMLEGNRLNDDQVRFAAASIAQALDILQTECQVLYRNFSPEYIQVRHNGCLALMDLRFAKRNAYNCTTLCGSPGYFAPEMMRGEIQSIATDWWGFGVLLFEMADGEMPWVQVDDDDLGLLAQISQHVAGSMREPRGGGEQIGDLINGLLNPDASKRVGAQGGQCGVLDSAYFGNKINWTKYFITAG